MIAIVAGNAGPGTPAQDLPPPDRHSIIDVLGDTVFTKGQGRSTVVTQGSDFAGGPPLSGGW